MTEKSYPRLSTLFRFILGKRFWILGFYALILPPSIYFSLQVKQDNSPDRLIVKTDEEYKLQKLFEQTFEKNEQLLLYFDAKEVFTPEVLRKVQQIEARFSLIEGVTPTSLISLFQRRGTGQNEPFQATPEQIQSLKNFALPKEQDFLIRQGFINAARTSLGMQVVIKAKTGNILPEFFQNIHQTFQDALPNQSPSIPIQKPFTLKIKTLHDTLSFLDEVLKDAEKTPSPFLKIRKIGQPYVSDYLDQDVRAAGFKYFGLFGIFIVILTLFLYRSFRALLAILLSLGVCAALTMGFIGAIGGMFTIVSSLVPMTILITATATLVYLHSRFVDQPDDKSVAEHQIYSLSNKFLACTASIFATAVGFAALAVSKIKPIVEMGIWVAVGLTLTWLVVFTLFPILQNLFKTPTQQKQKVAGQWFIKLAEVLPAWSYKYRILFVTGSLLWCVGGAIALFGLPKIGGHKILDRMKLETAQVEYINHDSKLYQDTKQIEHEPYGGLSVTEVWLQGKPLASIQENPLLHQTDPDEEGNPIEALEDFQKQIEKTPKVTLVMGWPNLLRMFSYFFHTGRAEVVPNHVNDILYGVALDVDKVASKSIPENPDLIAAVRQFVPITKQVQTRITIRTRTMDYEEHQAFHQTLTQLFEQAKLKHKELQSFQIKITGQSVLQAKVSAYLVPTLMESFGLTIAIIFLTFLLVFRSGAARIMAMIPSLFAILAMFSIMRLTGMSLNIATILIASTVLGSSENDQIHFFYHYQERKKAGGTTEEALKHTFLVAGKAIFFATLINAGGFLAFALADLPPIRQFGILTSLAFTLSMIADFIALPAALWLVFRAKPDNKLNKEK